ncbi:MAG: histidine kinase, partial [Lachnospiraceae bacterium]|nr:histidine kinase [Lachnospiraceae bacterium]
EYEVMALFDNYNMMMRRIRESELDTLRAQISPHFLYNTLNSIKCRALLDGNSDVAKMTQWLINLLELSINNRNEYVTLTEELDMLQSYVGLQKVRSNKEFLFQTEMFPEHLGKCLIPKMILQTLVENAILHGIEEKEYSDTENGAAIRVCASLDGENLQIEVWDNGIGMIEERIHEVFSAEQKNEKRKMNRVGLYNVDQRIKLYFGKKYGLSIKSTPGLSTTVTIKMPCTEKPEAFRREL